MSDEGWQREVLAAEALRTALVWALTVGVRRPAAVFVQPCVVVVVPGSRFDDGTLLHIETIKGDENDAQLRQLVTQLRAKAR